MSKQAQAAIALAAGLVLAPMQVLALSNPTPPDTTLPVVTIGTANLIGPNPANSYYDGLGAKTGITTFTTSTPPEIVQMARALKGNPDLIYEYVRNNIDMVWMYGEHKGALGAMIDKSGTSFDQAALMVALLRQSGYTANFQAGKISLTGTQFTAWTGIADSTAACQMLSSGGIPASINGSIVTNCAYGSGTAISTVLMAHIWVKVTIGGTDYLFDPSYKANTWKSGIDLEAASGFDDGQPLDDAVDGMDTGDIGASSDVHYVHNLNAGQMNDTLSSYASNLVSYMQSHDLLQAHMDDIVGGHVVTPYVSPSGGLRQTTISYVDQVQHDWTAIPDGYRATVEISGKMWNYNTDVYSTMFDRTFFADDIYGRAITVDTNFDNTLTMQAAYWSNVVTLRIDGVAIGIPYTNGSPISGYTVRGAPSTLTLAVDHPYASTSGGYMDTTLTKQVVLVTPVTVVAAFGDTGPGLLSKWSDERAGDKHLPFPLHSPHSCPGGETCPPNYIGTTGDFSREKAAAGWLGQYTRAAHLNAEIAKSVVQLHHVLGFIYGDVTLNPIYASHPGDPDWTIADSFDRMDVDSAFSVTSKTADAAVRRGAVHAIAASSATLEGSVAGQTADLVDTTSTATRFEWGNAPPSGEDPSAAGARKFLQFTSANVGSTKGSGNTATLPKAENADSSSTPVAHMFDMDEQITLNTDEVSKFRSALGNAAYDYAHGGFIVVASQEGFLGPGQRGGAFTIINSGGGSGGIDMPGTAIGYTEFATKQRGGAFVATKYDGNGDPIQISHDVTGLSLLADGSVAVTKGGGAGNQPDSMTNYGPPQPADILKSRFIDKASEMGANLLNGTLAPPPVVSLTMGHGDAPYALNVNMTLHDGAKEDQLVSPIVPTRPGAQATVNWQNNLAISGSGMEAMGQTDVRAAAGTIISLMATQDIYQATQSAQRDVAALLAQAWWAHQMSGNVATVSVGTNTHQFLKTASGDWVAPDGAKLVQTGSRDPYEFICAAHSTPPPYAMSRTWDIDGVAFDVIGRDGDVQHFEDWENSYATQGSIDCGRMKGFRLTTWRHPNGIVDTVSYGDAFDQNAINPATGIERITQVENSLGRRITFTVDSGTHIPTGFNNSLTGGDKREVSWSYDYTGTLTATDVMDQDTKYTFDGPLPSGVASQRPNQRLGLYQVFTPDNTTTANVQYDYDELGQILAIHDGINLQVGDGSVAGGRDTTTFYVAGGTRGERDDPLGGAYRVVYDTYGLPWRYIDELGRETTQEHDGRGRVTKTTYPEGDYETFTYDVRNNPLVYTLYPKPGSAEATASETIVKSMSYGEGATVTSCTHMLTCNKPATAVSANGYTTDFTWTIYGSDAAVALTQVLLPADAGGNRPQTDYTYTSYTSDGVRLLTDKTEKVTTSVSRSTSFSYDSSNHYVPQTVVVDPGSGAHLALTTALTYDAQGDPIHIDGPRAGSTDVSDFTYDKARRTVFAIQADPDGAGSHDRPAAKKTYDYVGNLTQTDRGTTTSATGSDFAANNWIKDTYDPDGNKSVETTGAGSTTTTATQFSYDGANRPLCAAQRMNPSSYGTWTTDACTTTPAGSYGSDRIVKTIYDAAGQTRQKLRAFGTPIVQTYSTQKYSDDGMELAVADADAGIAIGVSYADALNSLTATAHQTNYAYDGFGRLKKTTFADATHEDLTYDDGGNVLTRVNRSTQTLTYTYDHLDRMLTKNSPTGGSGTTTSWTYDLASQVTSLTDATTTVAATFDLAGRPLTSVQTLPGMSAKTVSYAYDNGAGDKLNRSRMTWPDGYYVDYAYDALNHLTTATDSGSTVLASRTYDNLARPATTQYPNSNDNIAYAWDAEDNLTTLTDNFTGSSADVSFTNTFTPAHQIADSTISKAGYRYTPAGSSTDTYTADGLNRIGTVNGSTLSYDGRGNLTGDGAWTYSFDPENHMTGASKTSGGTVTATYTYDPLGRRIAKSGTGVTATSYIHDGDSEIAEYDGSGALVRRFVPGPVIDQPIAMVTAAGTKTFFHVDKLGSVIAMSGTTGSRTEGPFLYDSYGNCSTASGGTCGTGVPFRYTGQRFDGETGLHYYRARYYSSKLGRFLQTDPIGYKDDLNWYAYVQNDPTDKTDPSGLCGPLCGGIIGGVLGGGLEVADQLLTSGKITSWSKVGQETVIGTIAGLTGTGAGNIVLKAQRLTSFAVKAAPAVAGAVGGLTESVAHGNSGTQVLEDTVKGAIAGKVIAVTGKVVQKFAGKIQTARAQAATDAGAARGELVPELAQSGVLSAGPKSGSPAPGAVAGASAEHTLEAAKQAYDKLFGCGAIKKCK